MPRFKAAKNPIIDQINGIAIKNSGIFPEVKSNKPKVKMVEISKRIPKGVICCDSALEYYKLSTINPGEIHVAVNANSNITKPDYPPVQLYYLSKNQFEIGINEIMIQGEKVRIYSPEKTICDCVKFRSRIGMEVVLESIKNYVKRKDRNLALLSEYSQKCRVEKILTKYLEVLVWVKRLKINLNHS